MKDLKNNNSEQNDLIIGDAALGRILGISVVTINRMKRANMLPYYKCGAKYLYCLADVLSAMECKDYNKLTNKKEIK